MTMLANEAKSAEATTARGSFALEDAVDFVRRISKEGDVTTISTADKVRVGIPTGPWRMRLVEPGGFEPSTGGGGSSLGGDPFQPFGRLDEEITGYLMAHPHSTARAVTRHVRHRFAVVAARLSAIAECGPDKTWRARPEAVPREGDAPGHTVSQSASHPHSHCPDTPGHTVSQGASHSTPPIGKHPDTPATDTRAGGTLFAGNDAKGVDAGETRVVVSGVLRRWHRRPRATVRPSPGRPLSRRLHAWCADVLSQAHRHSCHGGLDTLSLTMICVRARRGRNQIVQVE